MIGTHACAETEAERNYVASQGLLAGEVEQAREVRRNAVKNFTERLVAATRKKGKAS